jgi:arylsulfatase A-like enzyme
MSLVKRTLAAGFWGGMLAGVLDALATLLLSANILTFPNHLHLLLVDAGLGAFAGSALVIVFIGWGLGLEKLLGKSPWLSGSHAVAVLLAAPLVVYDAFAIFQGVQASRIPGHRWISVGLILLGLCALWLAVTLARCLLARAEPSTADGFPDGGRKRWVFLAGLVTIVAVLAMGWANLRILPRLYHWFHLSLSVLHLVLCMLAVRLFFGTARTVLGKRASWSIAAFAPVLLVVVFLVERPIVARSQALRFFIYEKTQLASIFARALPSGAGETVKGRAWQARQALPPLPSGPHLREADVVLITVDALRADHLGAYGYGRAVSPNIDALAARGVRFEHAYTQAPHTSFSLASVMTGKYYPTLARLASSDTHETLAQILRRYGWKTAAFFPPSVFYIDAHKMKAFESNNFDFEYVKYEYLDADARVGQIEDFLASENPKKLFLWLHLFEPHEPYEAHAGFDFGATDVDRYDSEIAYSDSVVGKVIALVQKKRPGSVIMVAADHGEEFGEHGGRYHGTTLFEEQVHVPFIVAAPGLLPHLVKGPSQLIDIPTTILGLLDLPIPARMRGTDLGPWLSASPAPVDRLPAVFAEVEDKRMVVQGSEKLICDVGKDFCSMFDLASDPREAHDLADSHPERLQALRQRLDGWLAEQVRYESKLLGAAGGAEPFARAIERGRLADASAAPELASLLTGNAPVEARREAATILVTVLPPRAETKAALLGAADKADDAEIKAWAAVAAFRVGVGEMADRLKASLAQAPSDGSGAAVLQAALALAEAGDGAGMERLTASFDSCGADVPVCKRIIAALGKLKDGRATKSLVDHLTFVQTRQETVDALASIADPASVPALIACLEGDEYVPVRADAARALGKLGGARALRALESALRREKEEAVLAAVRASLSQHGRR